LEKKLEARASAAATDSNSAQLSPGHHTNINPNRRGGAHRASSHFAVMPRESEEGVMIDPSQLMTHTGGMLSHGMSFEGGGPPSSSGNTRRKVSIVGKSPKHGRHNSVQSNGSGSGFGHTGSASQQTAMTGFPTGAQVPAAFYKEIEEQLADALFKRTQAKLMADPDQANVESALGDGLKVCTEYPSALFSCVPLLHVNLPCMFQALTLFSEDDDYFMAVATCYMRLNKYDEALQMLQTVLDRSPNNYKALYHYAFCQRASGSQTMAIEGLTKVNSHQLANLELT